MERGNIPELLMNEGEDVAVLIKMKENMEVKLQSIQLMKSNLVKHNLLVS
jgi:hypothetical protein